MLGYRPFETGRLWYYIGMAKATKNDIEKYPIFLPRKKKTLNVRDYIIPTRRKKKTNWSERVDEILYGKK